MSLVRYDDNVFELEDVYGLDLYESGDIHTLRVVLRGGNKSFKIKFDSRREAERAFETICGELDVRDLTPSGATETAVAQ